MTSRIAHIAVTVSALVVATCALVLTVRAEGVPFVVRQPMTFDSAHLADRVHWALVERGDVGAGSGSVGCPVDVPILEGTVFGCSVRHNGRYNTVRVTVADAETGAIDVGLLSD